MVAHGYRNAAESGEARTTLTIGIFNWRDVRHPKAGGAEQYLHRQARYWIDAGHHVKWFSAGFRGASRHEVIDGIHVYRGGGEFAVYAIAPIIYMRYMRDCDVLIDAENGIPFFTPLFSRKPKLLLMFHVHRDVVLRELPPPLSWITWALEVWAMPIVYRHVPVVAISESTRDDVVRYRYTRLPVALVHSGVDRDVLSPGPKFAAPTIVYLGRIVRQKRLPKLIEIFSKIRESRQDAVLVIAGIGADLNACRATAASFGVQSAVIFEGFVNENRKRALLAGAWVAAQPSLVEGWGIGVIEAAACGTPSVAMRVPGLQDAIIDGETGRLVDSWDEFTNALTYILMDADYRKRLSDGALKYSEQFSWQKSANLFLMRMNELV